MEFSEDPVSAKKEKGPKFKGRTKVGWQAYWKDELDAEEKRTREWRRQADQIVKRFLDQRKDQGPQYNIGTAEFRVNLFYSNTFTLMCFLYGRVPQVDVSRRFTDTNDDHSRVAANILERMLNTSIQTDGGDFATVLRSNLEDHLVPGIGQTRVRYEVETEKVELPAITTMAEDGREIEVVPAREEERLLYEDAVVDYVHWRDFRWGWCRMWKDVPWVGFDVYMTRDEATKRFGAAIAKELTYEQHQVQTRENENTDNPDTRDPHKTACVTEIWHAKTESVYWYHKEAPFILDMMEDPLSLSGFYPCPRPMLANGSTALYNPRPYWILSQDLYNEVDQLSTRINIITNAVKVVGVYDKAQPELRRMLQGSIENDLVPVDNWAMMAEKGGLEGVIDFYPVQDVILTLDKLREMRREAIDLLYQVTGLSDIMRGSSDSPYESSAKTQLKGRMGSVRVQFLQDEFARFASDTLCLKAEIISKHFSENTIKQQSNIEMSYDAPLADQGCELIKQWDQAVWRIEVKPESMAMVDWAELKMDRTEFLNALAVFLQSSAPMLERMPTAAPLLLELLKWGLAGFKGGQEIETVIDAAIRQVQQNPPQQEQQQGGSELQKGQLKLVENRQKFQQDMAKQADKARKEMQKMITQFRLELEKIEAQTRADTVKEVVQADQNIREKRATQNESSRT